MKKVLTWLLIVALVAYAIVMADDPWKAVAYILGGIWVGWVLTDLEAEDKRLHGEIIDLRGEVRGLAARLQRSEGRYFDSMKRLPD